jgi:hypothetical protein
MMSRDNERANGGTGFPPHQEVVGFAKSPHQSNPIDLGMPKGTHSKRAEDRDT